MSSFATYQFLPWARRGLSAYITEADTLGKSAATVVERATVHLAVEVNADAALGAATDFQMIGPGDIVGVNADMIIRTEPLDGVTGYEPNYLPYAEFYDEDFPWRYTPARQVDAPGNASTQSAAIPGGRLRPWLALIVLKANEFEDTKRRQPLPSIKVTNPAALPPHDELHLWAHAHNNKPNTEDNKPDKLLKFIESLEDDYKTDPDGLYSRILCPRHLEADTLYHAFVVPSYETGRLSGLGRPIKDTKAQQPSWGPGAGDAELPVYHRWFFRTGENFDFESLVKLLEPRVMDDKVGTRPMDCSEPGYQKLGAAFGIPVDSLDPEIVYLEGALLAPQSKPRPEVLDTAQPFVAQLTELVKLNKTNLENQTEDPVVTVPFYGMYHAMEVLNTLPDFDPESKDLGGKDITKWQNELNRDPRWRVAAGFGTSMVQEGQEKFMDSAWKQLQKVLEANKKMQAAQMNAKVANKMHEKHFLPLADEKMLSMTRSVSARVPAAEAAEKKAVINPHGGPHLKVRETVKSAIQISALPAAALSHPFRRALRNQSKVLRLLKKSNIPPPIINHPPDEVPRAAAAPPPFARTFNAQVLSEAVDKLNNRKITAAPAINFSALTNLTSGVLPVPASAEQIKVWSVKSNTDDDFIYNLPDFKGGLPDVGKWQFVFGPQVNSPGAFINFDPTSGFLGGFTAFSSIFQPSIIGLVAASRAAEAAPAADFSAAFIDMNLRKAFATPVVVKPPVGISSISSATKAHVRPDAAFQRMLAHVIRFGNSANNKVTEDFLPAMAYPDFNEPTYEFLVKKDKELLLPNLDLIPPNTISLLRTNQKFIESYLVGLNYEMGRELLWREYPTDMRGSYFRQFWDVRGIVAPTTDALGSETAKDIKPIHTWLDKTKPLTWPLGRHNARDMQGDASQLVFVVRGELLKKFPNTVIFAQKASKNAEGKLVIDRDLSPDEYAADVLFPIYKAEIEPDIKLFGFDLTIEQAAGIEPGPIKARHTDGTGWFFIIAEVPGEPRFGMDLTFVPNQPAEEKWTWNDLSWESFNGQKLDFIRESIAPNFTTHDDEETPKPKIEDPNNSGTWGRSSADMATILFQRPVMIATHATEMLDEEVLDDNKPLNAPDAEVKLRAHFRTFVPKGA